MSRVSAIAGIVVDKPLHLLLACIAAVSIRENLPIDIRKLVVRVGIEIVGIPSVGANTDRRSSIGGGVGLISVESVDQERIGLKIPQHVVKGSVLHHQHNNALEG